MLCPNSIGYGWKPHDLFGPEDIDWRCSNFGPSKPKSIAHKFDDWNCFSKPKSIAHEFDNWNCYCMPKLFAHNIDWNCFSKPKPISNKLEMLRQAQAIFASPSQSPTTLTGNAIASPSHLPTNLTTGSATATQVNRPRWNCYSNPKPIFHEFDNLTLVRKSID